MATNLKYSPKERTNSDLNEAINRFDPQNQLVQKLVTKVDQWLALHEPGTQDHTIGLIMKASAIHFFRNDTNLENSIKVIEEALAIVKPFAETDIGFFPYVKMLSGLVALKSDDGMKCPILFKMIKEGYDLVMKLKRQSQVLAWDFYSLYCSSPPPFKTSEKLKEFLKREFSYFIFNHHRLVYTAESEAKLLEFIIPAMRYLMDTIDPFSKYTRLSEMSVVVEVIWKGHRLKQLDHCLAGLMFHTVNYRRSLPDHQRHTVSKIQAKLSNAFLHWGFIIAFESMKQIAGEKFAIVDNRTYEEIEEFNESGVEIYAHQFPIDLVKTPEALEKVIKRCKAWYKRSRDLLKEAKEENVASAAPTVLVMIELFHKLFPDRQIKGCLCKDIE